MNVRVTAHAIYRAREREPYFKPLRPCYVEDLIRTEVEFARGGGRVMRRPGYDAFVAPTPDGRRQYVIVPDGGADRWVVVTTLGKSA